MPKRTLAPLLVLATLAGAPVQAALHSQSLDGRAGKVDLIDSKLTVQVGAQWLDVEEEAEIRVVPTQTGSKTRWIVEGTMGLPEGAVVTGCMLWNGDTLLMGKLRVKQQANAIFDSLVPPRNPVWARDPLLVEQLSGSESTYGLKLFPFEPNGSRRFRLRYLVPRPVGWSEVTVKPALSWTVDGSIPSTYRLRLRGTESNLRLIQGDQVWPVELPFSERVNLERTTDVRVRWTSGGFPDGGRAVRGSQPSGPWAGDYAMYSGKVPDSIIGRLDTRSETVVLWSWIRPESLVDWCKDAEGTRTPCLSISGNLAMTQIVAILGRLEELASAGKTVALVADLGLGDSLVIFPPGDSSSASWHAMREWGYSLEADLPKRITPSSVAGGNPTAEEIREAQRRFGIDLRRVASLFTDDSAVVKHVVIVTAGAVAASATPEPVDPSILPAEASVASTDFYDIPWVFDPGRGYWVSGLATPAFWPGVDLAGLVRSRQGLATTAIRQGVRLPRLLESLPARLSMATTEGRAGRNILLVRDPAGRYRASLSVHGKGLSQAVSWSIFGDSGKTIASWSENPSWVDVGADSILPKLWTKSERPVSSTFEDRNLGAIFGVVDSMYSLLATPSDTLGILRQSALRDSGVPFLAWTEIFARQAYGQDDAASGEGGGSTSGIGDPARSGTPRLCWLAGRRTLRIQLDGVDARGLEIRDVQGRVLVTYSASQLDGRMSLEWAAPEGLGRGMLLVSVRTAAGLKTSRILMN